MLLPTFDVGNKNYILGNAVVMLINPDSKPARRLISEAKTTNKYIDLTKGKAGKCLILLDNDEIVMSFLTVKTIKKRYMRYVNKANQEKGEIVLEPFIDVGFENFILSHKVTSILNANTIPIKKIIKNAKLSNTILDCTQGRKTRSAILLLNGFVVISQTNPQTIKKNFMLYINNFYNINEEDLIDDTENEENDEDEYDDIEVEDQQIINMEVE